MAAGQVTKKKKQKKSKGAARNIGQQQASGAAAAAACRRKLAAVPRPPPLSLGCPRRRLLCPNPACLCALQARAAQQRPLPPKSLLLPEPPAAASPAAGKKGSLHPAQACGLPVDHNLTAVQEALGYQFKDLWLLRQALIHPSFGAFNNTRCVPPARLHPLAALAASHWRRRVPCRKRAAGSCATLHAAERAKRGSPAG